MDAWNKRHAQGVTQQQNQAALAAWLKTTMQAIWRLTLRCSRRRPKTTEALVRLSRVSAARRNEPAQCEASQAWRNPAIRA